MEFIQIQVEQREARGSRAMHRMRREARVPAVLYGLGRRNLPLTMPAEALDRFLRSGSHLVELEMGGETRDAILREVQVDPLTDKVLHVDFQRVEKDAPVEDEVPVVFKGTAKGMSEGGLFQTLRDLLRVSARPRDLPREILIDVSPLGVGDEIRVQDVKVSEGVTLLDDAEALVAHCVPLKEVVEEEETSEEGGPAEPEIVGRKTDDEGAEG